MSKWRLATHASAVTLGLMLAACGGGGSGGGGGPISTPPPAPAPTPTPAPTPAPTPPPTGANDDLLAPLASESFTNAGSRAAATFTAGGATATASAISAAITFNAANNSYALTTPTGSITFGPSDVDATQSSAGAVVYVKTSGNRTDTLTLTRPGTSGPITYRYVGGAFWQRTTTASGSVTGSIDALVYGVETPPASVPRTGSANYLVDLVGAITTADNLFPLVGGGTISADFGSGQVLVVGVIDIVPIRGTSSHFNGSAALSSVDGQFSGSFTFEDLGTFNGQLSGMLFGPNAEEIGASWSAANGERVAVGALLGRRDTDDLGNAAFDPTTSALPNSQTFNSQEAVLRFDFDERLGFNQQVGDFVDISASSGPLAIRYDSAANSYALSAPGLYGYYRNSTFSGLGPTAQASWGRGAEVGPTSLTYLRAGLWTYSEGVGSTIKYRLSHHVYGMPTLQSELVRTGTAGYRILVRGVAADNAYRNPMAFSGLGDLFVEFSDGRVSGYVPLDYGEMGGLSGLFPVTVLGSWRYSGTMAADRNAFAGTVEMDGIGTYVGLGSGQFFGPSAQEVGGIFVATEAGGHAAAGTFIGLRDDTVRDPTAITVLPLANLPAETQLAFRYHTNINQVADIKGISFDPVGNTYNVSFQPLGMMDPPTNTLTFSNAQRDVGASTPDVDLFRTTYLSNPAVVRKLAPTATVALSYASFAEISIQRNAFKVSDAVYYVSFGNPTIQMPRTGSASYSGLAMGSAEVRWLDDSGWQYDIYELLGTSSLNVDFGTASFVMAIGGLGGARVFSGPDRGAGYDSVSFPTLTFNGQIAGAWMMGTDVDRSFAGGFYGPNADEFAGVFRSINIPAFQDDYSSSTTLSGAVAGKKD
jgi:hypothetical protein